MSTTAIAQPNPPRDTPLTDLQKKRSLKWVLIGTPFYGAWAALSLSSEAVLFLNELGFPKSQIGC